MNRIALGTVQFGLNYGVANEVGQVTPQTAKQMLELAINNNINTLDTAIAYGESEVCLGKAIGTKEFKIITKLPAIPDDCLDVGIWIQDQVTKSFNRLGVSSVYCLLLHRSSQLLDINGNKIYQTLQNLKASGFVKNIGVSIYSPTELDMLHSKFHFDLVQVPFNIFDRRLIRSDWLYRLKDHGVEVHVRSVFLQGLLLMAENKVPEKFLRWKELFKVWHEWLRVNNVSALQTCLAYPLSFDEIDRVVIGADSVNQLEQIISSSKLTTRTEFPQIMCNDESLINPANWNSF